MIAASRQTGNQLLEAFHYRFHRLMKDALELIRHGTLGHISRASAIVRYPIPTCLSEPRWNPELGGGATMDLGCYGVHALRTLLRSEPDVLEAKARMARGVDAQMDAQLCFAGVEATLNTAMDPADAFTEIRIEGSRSALVIDGFVLPHRSGRLQITFPEGTREVPVTGPSSYAAQLAHVVEVMRGDTRPLTGGEDSIANMAVIDGIRR